MKKIITILLFTLFAVVTISLYAGTLKGIPGNPNQQILRIILTKLQNRLNCRTRKICTSNSSGRSYFDLTQTLADAVYPDVGYYQGRYYAYFAPGIALLAAPLYMIGAKYNLLRYEPFLYQLCSA